MEVYTLDALLRRITVTDKFESLIWTERFNETGDFELVLNSTQANRRLFTVGTYLAMNESFRVMIVESVEDKTDADNKRTLTIKGPSLEMIMDDRVAKATMSDTTSEPKWIITDKPADVARKIFHDICVTGTLDPLDVIPYIVEGTFMPDDTIEEPVDPITTDLDPTTVLLAIQNICQVWNLGYRILRNYDESQIYFDIYSGSDRTSGQTLNAPVIFTPELDNLQNTTELTQITNAKNVAYVFSPAGFAVVYAVGVDPEIEGFERRVLVVNATDITEESTEDVEAALSQRGTEALAANRTYSAFDGEINQNSQYKYQSDYYLGDIVEMRNSDGVTNNMRVTEQIFVSDSQGERSYPTLTMNTYINTGSWLSWTSNTVWEDMGETEYWENQP